MSLLLTLLTLLALTVTAHAAEPIPLRAGPITMVFDAENAFLRYVRIGPHEVLRGINAPIRNESWANPGANNSWQKKLLIVPGSNRQEIGVCYDLAKDPRTRERTGSGL